MKEKTKGQKVYIKYDKEKYDGNDLLCYLYLKNKTFINAHLIKHGFASADKDTDYSYKDKFIKLVENLTTENAENTEKIDFESN